MVVKRRLIRRKPVEEEDEEEEEEVEAELEEEEDEIEDEEEEEEEEEEKPRHGRGMKPSKKVKVPEPKKVKKVKVPEPEYEDEEEEEEEEAPKKVKVQKVETTVVSSLILDAVNHLGDGKALIISNLGKERYSLAFADAAPVAKEKLRGKAYSDIVTNPEYHTWSHEWHQKTYEQKVAFAEKKKIKWDRQKNPKVDVIHLTEAVRRALGIEKYKEEYRSRSARAALRGG